MPPKTDVITETPDLTNFLGGQVVLAIDPPDNSISLIYADGRVARFYVHPDDNRIAFTVTQLPTTH